jgi:hypothetical protein
MDFFRINSLKNYEELQILVKILLETSNKMASKLKC